MPRSTFREGGFREGLEDSLPWVAIAVAVGLLVCMVIATGFRLMPRDRDVVIAEELPGPAPVVPAPPRSAAPSVPAAPVTSVTSAPTAKEVRPSYSRRPVTGAPSAVARPSSPAPVPTVTGRYRVMAPYDREFIGEVLVTNTGGRPEGWVVELTFPDDVGDLRTSWVESQPQATLTRSGDRYIWRSGVTVAPGTSHALRFQYAHTGTGGRPRSCTVNGSPCSVA